MIYAYLLPVRQQRLAAQQQQKPQRHPAGRQQQAAGMAAWSVHSKSGIIILADAASGPNAHKSACGRMAAGAFILGVETR
jgi:hypothetical protein